MTETEWLTSTDPQAMLAYLLPDGELTGRAYVGVSDRKLRLFACACFRLTGYFRTPDPVDLWEETGHPLTPNPARWAANWAASDTEQCWITQAQRASVLRDIFGNPFRPVIRQYGPSPIKKILAGTWRQPSGIVLDSWLTWHDGIVPRLAQAAYDERGRRCQKCRGLGTWELLESRPILVAKGNHTAFSQVVARQQECIDCHGTGRIDDGTLDPDRLAVMADALEEAGCKEENILGHCRHTGPHVRGCWCFVLFFGLL